jgi:hypothetical protein
MPDVVHEVALLVGRRGQAAAKVSITATCKTQTASLIRSCPEVRSIGVISVATNWSKHSQADYSPNFGQCPPIPLASMPRTLGRLCRTSRENDPSAATTQLREYRRETRPSPRNLYPTFPGSMYPRPCRNPSHAAWSRSVKRDVLDVASETFLASGAQKMNTAFTRRTG